MIILHKGTDGPARRRRFVPWRRRPRTRPRGLLHRLVVALLWVALLVVSVLVGGLGFAYLYITDSDTLAALIREEAPRYLPGSRLMVGRVRLRPFVGEVELRDVSLTRGPEGRDVAVSIPWLGIKSDMGALWEGRYEPTRVEVAHPVIKVSRRRDGTWGVQGLLADPWPGPPTEEAPPVKISNGTIQLLDGAAPMLVLREVSLEVRPTAAGHLQFEGHGKGDVCDRVELRGTIDPETGRLHLEGALNHLGVSEGLRRLPADLRPPAEALGLTAGEIDVGLTDLVVDPKAPPGRRVRYEATAELRAGSVSCPKLPFRLDDVSALLRARNGSLTLNRAEGHNGKTTVRARGTLPALGDPEGPMDVSLAVDALELEKRLRDWTPPEFASLWREYQPQGQVDLAARLTRRRRGGPIAPRLKVECRDVALRFHLFPYPVEHIRGGATMADDRIVLDLRAPLGGRPASARGTIDHPGDEAVVALTFAAETLPVDATLMAAIQDPGIKAAIAQFEPSGTVRGTATLHRVPDPADPIGKVTIDADIDLNPGCAIRWEGMKYPIANLTGHLEVHPDRWSFRDMQGTSSNGLARISGHGQVVQVAPNKFKTDLWLSGRNLPFDQQLRDALPPEWQAAWDTLGPSGSTAVDAEIHLDETTGRERYLLSAVPDPGSRVRLVLTPVPGTPTVAGGVVRLPTMEEVRGRFVFDNGKVTMTGVTFGFHEAPVRFRSGTFQLLDRRGRFDLRIDDLEIEGLRTDAELRKVMPPIMAGFAQKLDDGRSFSMHADLAIGWSGAPGQPAWCAWDDATVVFTGNSFQADLPLENIQGQVDHLRGRSDGRSFELHGVMELESVNVLGQQLTKLGSPIHVKDGAFRLEDIEGRLLDGVLNGRVSATFDGTPHYEAHLLLQGARLESYTRTVPGRQDLRGLVRARLDVEGFGQDLKTLRGTGALHVTDGDLGTQPLALRLLSAINRLDLSRGEKPVFDAADLDVTIRDGEARLDAVKLTGDAFSLHGDGVLGLGPQGTIDLKLRVGYGRDEWRLPILGAPVRAVSNGIFNVRVTGPVAYPKFEPEVLPGPVDVARFLRRRRDERVDERRARRQQAAPR